MPPEAAPVMLEGLKDPEDRVRANVAQVLLRLAEMPAAAGPLLAECTTRSDDAVRLNAVRALKALHYEGRREVCQRLVQDPNFQVRLEAAHALLLSEPDNTAAAAVVAAALADPLPKLRRQGAELLSTLGDSMLSFAAVVVERVQAEEEAEVRAVLEVLHAEVKRLRAPPPALSPPTSGKVEPGALAAPPAAVSPGT